MEEPILFAGAIHASKTATPDETEKRYRRHLAVNSSVLLMSFALALCCEKIHPSLDAMPLGHGGDSAMNLSALIMRCCPSDSERVVLALTIDGKGCSCSPSYRTPTARDWKGMSAKKWRERTDGDKTPTLPDQLGGVPHPDFVEELMGFPIGWTDCARSVTQTIPA